MGRANKVVRGDSASGRSSKHSVGQRCDHGWVASQNVLKNRKTTFQQTRSGSKSALAIKILVDGPLQCLGKSEWCCFGGKGDLSVSWPQIS